MDYKEKYEHGLECIQEILSGAGDSIKTSILRKRLQPFFPELKESKDERIRKALVRFHKSTIDVDGIKGEDILAWLEKQKDISSKEYVFRPLAGCDIDTAAIQAVEQQKLGNKVVLAFNGAYIPVEEKNPDDIVNEYHSWVKKQISPGMIAEAYLRGCNDTEKKWIEKQDDKDKLIQELGKYKVKYTQDVLEKHINSMSNKDDERLRKTTIAFLKDFAEQGYENAVECIDWLEKQKSVAETVKKCKDSWYNEGKIAGQAEGLTVDERYWQGYHDALEKQSKPNKTMLIPFNFNAFDSELQEVSYYIPRGYFAEIKDDKVIIKKAKIH